MAHRCNPRVKGKVEATATTSFKFTVSSSGLNLVLELYFEFRGEARKRGWDIMVIDV